MWRKQQQQSLRTIHIQGIARKLPIGAVSDCLKHNTVSTEILYSSDVNKCGENSFGDWMVMDTFAKDYFVKNQSSTIRIL